MCVCPGTDGEDHDTTDMLLAQHEVSNNQRNMGTSGSVVLRRDVVHVLCLPANHYIQRCPERKSQRHIATAMRESVHVVLKRCPVACYLH